MKYDVYNSELTVDSIDLVTYDCIRSWIDAHIDLILSDNCSLSRNYLTCAIDLSITIVCCGYVVASYCLSSDCLYIQHTGYDKLILK